MSKTIIFLAAALLSLPTYICAGEREESGGADAVKIADEIITMRSSLAQGFIKPDAEITAETFKNVCGAVAKRVKEITEKERVKIRHAAVKNRNPANAARADEVEILNAFDRDRGLRDKWDFIEADGNKAKRYMRPIFVEKACLACHGPKEKRPKFIVENYPDDKAFDFKEGDLRGMMEVIIPQPR